MVAPYEEIGERCVDADIGWWRATPQLQCNGQAVAAPLIGGRSECQALRMPLAVWPKNTPAISTSCGVARANAVLEPRVAGECPCRGQGMFPSSVCARDAGSRWSKRAPAAGLCLDLSSTPGAATKIRSRRNSAATASREPPMLSWTAPARGMVASHPKAQARGLLQPTNLYSARGSRFSLIFGPAHCVTRPLPKATRSIFLLMDRCDNVVN